MKKKRIYGSSWPFASLSKTFRIMKLICLFMFVALLQVSASSYSQSVKLNISGLNVTLEEVFGKIEEQSEFSFIYNLKQIDLSKKVNVDFENEQVEKILDQVLDGTNITYTVNDRLIVVHRFGESFKLGSSVGQQNSVSGIVTDFSGEPLPGVTVVVKGTTNGTITDFDGNYTISNVPENSILQFSFVGMKATEIAVDNQTAINVTLEEETIGLEEVIAIGYGTTTRQNFTGSVAEVKLEDSPTAFSNATNALSLLRGLTTGISVSQAREAGDEPTIQVRGQKSISDDAGEPLYVVDGVIFSGSMNDIDPSNIESFQILKDATTLAAYGSKAANGVIMISMKKGKRGKPVFNFNSYATITTPGLKPEMRDKDGYIELMSYRVSSTPDADPTSWMGTLEYDNYQSGKTTDWVDYIDRTGVLQNYSLSFSGATDNTNYYLSGSHLDQQGNYFGDDYSRNTFNARFTTDINEYLEINANTMFSYNKYTGVSPSYGQTVTLSPMYEPELPDGRMRKYVDGDKEESNVNPLWNTYNGIEDERVDKTNVYGGYLNLKIPGIEGLSFKVTGSYTLRSREQNRFTHETNFPKFGIGVENYSTAAYDEQLISAEGYVDSREWKNWVLDNILTYSKRINSHYINASLVYTRNSSQYDRRRIEGSDFRGIGNTTLGIYGLPNAEIQNITDYNYSLHNDVGYLARANYSFNDTYHLNLLTRYDGSSVFGSDTKWGFFPSVGGAWTISNESFMQGISQIDNLKFRLSWGKNGNQSLSPYSTLSTLGMGRGGGRMYYFDDNVAYGQRITALGNTALGWESTESVNYGFDAELLGSLSLNFDGYTSKTTDQIFERNIPIMGSGISEQDATMGRVDNWGIEVSVSNRNIDNSNFSWTTRVLFSMNRNELVELYGDGQDDIANELFIGKSLGAIYGYVLDGVVNEGEEDYVTNLNASLGDAQFKDISGPDGVPDGAITPDDRTILGFNKENFRLSMSNTFRYKNFDLYILFNGIFSGNDYGMAANNNAFITAEGYFYRNTLDHPFWTPENKSEEYPRWDYSDGKFDALQPIGHIRLQDVNLSYTFDNQMLSKFGVTGLQLYASASNLFFISPNWDFTDPEVRRYNTAQIPRTYKFGLNLKF